MVIYDTKNNNNGQVKGRLHLSAMDIDYLVSKYGVEGLIDLIPTDYVECFKFELDKRKKESKLSVQYYASLSLGIETTFDEKLLDIIQTEIDEGTLFTKEELSSLKEEELEQRIYEIHPLFNDVDSLSPESLYKLRSYKMAQGIFKNFNLINHLVENLYSGNSAERREDLNNEYMTRMDNLISIGLSSEIDDSHYFDIRSKKYNK